MRRFIYSSLEYDETGIRLISHRTNLISGTANAYGSRLIDTVCLDAFERQNSCKAFSFNMIAAVFDLFPTEKSPPLELIYEQTVMRSFISFLVDSALSLEEAMENLNGSCWVSNTLSDQTLLQFISSYEAQAIVWSRSCVN